MDKADGRARWMRSRGVEIYTPPTLAILKDFQTSREYDESVANAVLASAGNTFLELMRYMPEAANDGLLRYLDRQGFDATLQQSISVFNDEIVSHTAAVNGWIYDFPAEKRDTTAAAIHFVDSLMFGLGISMALASDAYLDKHGYDNYLDMPLRASTVDELADIMRNESFAWCIETFSKTGFGVLGDSVTSTRPGVAQDAIASVRLFQFGLSREQTSMFFYNSKDDSFAINPLVVQKLQKAYLEQNRGEYKEYDHSQDIGHHDYEESYITAGCPERYIFKDFPKTGVETAIEFGATFFESVASYIRLNLPAIPQLVELARLALQQHPQDEKLLCIGESLDNLED